MKITQDIEKRIDEWVDSHEKEYLTDLGELVGFNSTACDGRLPGDKPFGDACAAVLARAKKLAESYGFKAENRDNFCVVANLGDEDEKVGIFGHLDVVPAGGDWEYYPFGLTVQDGLIIGRGVMDDKGPLWASVYAVRCLKELDLLPRRGIEIFMGSDEEKGMLDIDHYVETSRVMPVVSFTPDGSYPICHGEKGIMNFWFDIPAGEGNIVDFTAGTVTNVVADHAELLLSGIDAAEAAAALKGDSAFTVKAEGGNTRITARGAAVHASLPENGVNAIGILAKAVLEHGFARGGAVPALQFVADVLASYNGEPFGAAFEDEPSGKLTHVGGVMTFSDNTLHLSIDIRYPVTVNGADVLAAAKAFAEKRGCGLTEKTDSHPIYIDADSDLVKLSVSTVNRVMGKDWKPFTMGGGTYARHLKNAYALGAEDPDFKSPFGLFRGSMHQADECAPIKLLLDTARIYARLLLELDELDF